MRSAILLLLAAFTMTTTAAEAATKWRAFRALKLYVSDTLDANATVFSSRGTFVAVPVDSEVAYLITPKEFTVHRIAIARLAFTDDVPSLDVSDMSGFGDPLILDKDGSVMNWEDGGLRFRLSAKPPLIGAVSFEDLTSHTKKYEVGIETYEPNANALQTLRSVDQPTEIVVGFGTWCSICAEWLPRFIKSVNEAANDHLSVTYVSINEALDQPADLMKKYGLDGVPAFIVRRGDKELGRVTGDRLEEEASPVLETMLADILTN